MTKKNELNIEEIKILIPHRYPFLLIDKLLILFRIKAQLVLKM